MDLIAQSLSVDILHGDEMHAFALADLVDVRDVRMIQRGGSHGFLIKSPQSILVRSEIRGQDFQCDLAMQTRVFRQIHLAHSARADLRADLVASEFCSRRNHLKVLSNQRHVDRIWLSRCSCTCGSLFFARSQPPLQDFPYLALAYA